MKTCVRKQIIANINQYDQDGQQYITNLHFSTLVTLAEYRGVALNQLLHSAGPLFSPLVIGCVADMR